MNIVTYCQINLSHENNIDVAINVVNHNWVQSNHEYHDISVVRQGQPQRGKVQQGTTRQWEYEILWKSMQPQLWAWFSDSYRLN